MKKLFVVVLAFFTVGIAQGQSFLVKKNVLGVGLYTPFEKPGGYALSYERMLDKGHSLNAAQFAVKLNFKLINDDERAHFNDSLGVSVFDLDAYQYEGFSFTPEVKYYFTWNAPIGPYFSLYASYSRYSENFFLELDPVSTANYEKKISKLGRGIGAGYQFRFSELLSMDIGGGYIMEDIRSKQKNLGELVFSPLDNQKDDGLRVSVSFGILF